jgi:PAS domain S-box-containing protein
MKPPIEHVRRMLEVLHRPAVWWRRLASTTSDGLPETTRSQRSAGRSLALSAGVLVSGIALTLWASHRVNESIEAQAQAHFERLSDRVEANLQRRFAMPLFGLNSASGILKTREKLDRSEFRNYVSALNLAQQFPGVKGFGFIVQVPRDQLTSFEQQERAERGSDFSVHSSSQAPDLFVIQVIEPEAKNRSALGHDISSEPIRHEALMRAIRTGQPTLSGRVSLFQDPRHRPALIYFLPIYRGAPTTEPQRLAQLIGVYHAPIVIDEILAGLTEAGDHQIDLTLTDGGPGNDTATLLYQEQAASPTARATAHAPTQGYTSARELRIGNRQWTLRLTSNAAFSQGIDRSIPNWISLGGSTLSFLMALVIWLMANARHRAEALAADMTGDLERLAEVVKLTSNAVTITDPDQRITWINEGFTRLYGYVLPEAQGRTVRELVISPNCPAGNLRQLDKRLAQDGTCRVELLNRSKTGQEFWVDTEIQVRRDASGQVIGHIEITQNVSDLKEAKHRLEMALRETDALLRTLNQYAMVSVADHLGRIIEVNDAFCATSGYSREELLGHNHRIINSGQQNAQFWVDMWRTISGGTHWRGEICNRARNGSLFWVDSIITPFIGANGKIDRYIAISHDVTQRKLSEEQVRSSQAFLDRASRIARLGSWQMDLRTHKMLWSREADIIHEIDPESDVSTEARLALLPAETMNRLRSAASAAMVHGTPWDFDVASRTINGRPLWLRSVGAAEFENGQPRRLVGTIQDVTESYEARARLSQTTMLLTNVLNAASEIAVIAIGPDAVINVFNTGAERLLGYRAVDVIGQCTPALFHQPAQFERRARKLEARLGRPPQTVEVLIETKWLGTPREVSYVRGDGSLVPVSIVITEMRSEQGEVTGYLCIAQDVTQRLKYEASMKAAMEAATQANAAKGQFVANVSHEIRTPMNAILGMLKLLRKTPLNPTQRDYAHKTERAAHSMLSLLNDILDFSKAEAGKMTLDLRTFPLTPLLQDLSVILSANIGDKPVQLQLDIDPALPPALVGDDLRLQQVLINLGGNAIKFTPQGEVVVGLRVLSQSEQDVRLRISVQDTGIGIAPDAQRHIFEGFSQAEGSTTRQYGGTGLGLAISQRLVELMGGCLQVESSLGRGSTFWFEVTLALPPQNPASVPPLPITGKVHASAWLDQISAASADDSPPAPPLQRLAGMRILMVEDNATNRQVAGELLRDEGALVREAHNGLEGVQAVMESPDQIDAVLMDMQMPVMDGLSACARLHALLGAHTPPIIAMTANLRPSDLQATQEAGMVAHIGKPFELEDLVTTLQAYAGRPHNGGASGAASLPRPAPLPDHILAEAQAQQIDLPRALSRLNGRRDVYLNLLRSFMLDLAEAEPALPSAWHQGDQGALSSRLHTLKGLAGTLGHTPLHDALAKAESAVSNTPASPELPTWLQEAMAALRTTQARLPQLVTLLEATDAPAKATPDANAFDPVAIRQTCLALIRLLQRSDMKAIDVHTTLRDSCIMVMGDQLTALDTAIHRLDFKDAILECQRLMDNLPPS